MRVKWITLKKMSLFIWATMKRPFGETSTMPMRLESASFLFAWSSEDSEDLVFNAFDCKVFDDVVSRKRFKMLLLLLLDVGATDSPLFGLLYSREDAFLLFL